MEIKGNMYKEIIEPGLMKLDSETWHTRAREAVHLAEATPFTLKLLEQFADRHHRFTDERLTVVLGGVKLDNPVVVGAGWGKAGLPAKALSTLRCSWVA